MTVRKAVADEQLGVLARRNAEIVQRLQKGAIPVEPVLEFSQALLDGRYELPWDTRSFLGALLAFESKSLTRAGESSLQIKHTNTTGLSALGDHDLRLWRLVSHDDYTRSCDSGKVCDVDVHFVDYQFPQELMLMSVFKDLEMHDQRPITAYELIDVHKALCTRVQAIPRFSEGCPDGCPEWILALGTVFIDPEGRARFAATEWSVSTYKLHLFKFAPNANLNTRFSFGAVQKV